MLEHQWWGALPLSPGARLQIGPSRLWLRQGTDELRIALKTDSDPISDVLTRQLSVDEPAPPADFDLHRFAVVEGSGMLRLRPILADRPVIARPTLPFALPSGASVTVFISTVLWTEFSLDDVSLITLPLFRPSDTWFGRSTIDGELCYAVRTALRIRLQDIPRRPHRAITAVHISNQGPDRLRLHRIRLPVQHLTVFADARGELWTEALEMRRSGAGEATITLRDSPPAAVGQTEQLSAPNTPLEATNLLQAITSFLP